MKTSKCVWEPVEINLSEGPTYEAAAKVFAYLAFPDPLDMRRCVDLWHALCQQYLHRRAAKNPEWAKQPQRIRPIHFTSLPNIERNRLLIAGFRRWRSRVASALDIGLPHLYQLATLDGLPTTVENLALRMKRHLGSDHDGGDVNNVKVKHWMPSRPVLHLACAFVEMEYDALSVSVHFRDQMPKYYDDAELLGQMLQWSEDIRSRLAEYKPSLYRKNEMISFVIC